MTMPHQCRCAICGEIGVITAGLPNVFAMPEGAAAGAAAAETLQAAINSVDPPRATCTHGYTICKVCKFPPDVTEI